MWRVKIYILVVYLLQMLHIPNFRWLLMEIVVPKLEKQSLYSFYEALCWYYFLGIELLSIGILEHRLQLCQYIFACTHLYVSKT